MSEQGISSDEILNSDKCYFCGENDIPHEYVCLKQYLQLQAEKADLERLIAEKDECLRSFYLWFKENCDLGCQLCDDDQICPDKQMRLIAEKGQALTPESIRKKREAKEKDEIAAENEAEDRLYRGY